MFVGRRRSSGGDVAMGPLYIWGSCGGVMLGLLELSGLLLGIAAGVWVGVVVWGWLNGIR